jgi:hypothetical protein
MQRRKLAQHIAGITYPGSSFGYVPIPAPDGGPAGGGGDTGGTDDKGGGADDKGGSDDKPKTLTQDQVNSLIAAERRKIEGKYADYEDLKTKAAAHDKAVEDAKTENEKAIDAARSEGRTEVMAAANARLIAAEARALVAEARFAKPELAVRALDLKDVKISDDGEVDVAAIKAKVKELADSGAFVIDDGKGGRPKPDRAQGGAGGKGEQSVSAGRDMYESRHGKKSA